MKIKNNNPSVKEIKIVHFFRTDELPFSLSEVLKNSYEGFITSNNYLQIAALPENAKINSSQKNSNSGVYWSHKISLEVNEQHSEIRDLLDMYENALVVCCIETRGNQVYIYGNSDQTLKMLYKDIDPTNPLDNVGHEITLSGDTYGSPKIITTEVFNTPIQLASWLATPL